jgi:NAD(P)-dependent dehydrogenase (short-subunit alcohol dehydrogenase family)
MQIMPLLRVVRTSDADRIDKLLEGTLFSHNAFFAAMMYGLTMTLKNEIVKIAPKGRVNCVAPGWVDTPMAADALKNPNVIYQALATSVALSAVISCRGLLTATMQKQYSVKKDSHSTRHSEPDCHPRVFHRLGTCHWAGRHGRGWDGG